MRACAALCATALLAVLALPAGAQAAGPTGIPGIPTVTPRFRATMPDRFGLDADGDGVTDLPNSARYVQGCPSGCTTPTFTLQLDAGGSRATLAGRALPIREYRWRVTAAAGTVLRRSSPQSVLQLRLPEGRYRVALDVEADLGWGTATARLEQEVRVEDLLIVAVGDSYASGEGNPEVSRLEGATEARWADAPGDPAVAAAHTRAHRSTTSWPALVALALERADPATSVTFVSLASTGAAARRGVLEDQSGEGGPGQLEELASLVGRRRVDLLLISVGGNDIGFPLIVRGLVDADPQADPLCYEVDLGNVWQAAQDGDWNRDARLSFGWREGITCREIQAGSRPRLPGLQGLPAELDALAAAVDRRLSVGTVVLAEYPDPSGAGERGETCREIAGDLTPPFGIHEIDTAEQLAARARVLTPLNRVLEEAAARHGWLFAGGLAAAFAAGHGYCAPAPDYRGPGEGSPPAAAFPLRPAAAWYRHPAREDLARFLAEPGVSWYRTAAQSALLQGPTTRWDTQGTLHPNELGHLAIAARVLELLQASRA